MSGLITNLLGIKLGFSFSAGAIDFVLNFTHGTKAWELIPIGIIFFFIYFGIFYWVIRKFDIKTPGREDDEDVFAAAETGIAGGATALSSSDNEKDTKDKYQLMAEQFFSAIGGSSNLDRIDYCTTRLRLKVHDTTDIDEAAIKRAGARGVVKIDKNNVQIIVGTEVEFVADALNNIDDSAYAAGTKKTVPIPKKESERPDGAERVYAPVNGEQIKLEDVPDPVFSQKMMGEGLAIRPSDGIFVAPVDGDLIQLAETGHAYGIRTAAGEEILVHIGLDTVNLKGEGFKVFAKEGDRVVAGQKIVEADLAVIREKAKSDISMIVVTNSMENKFIFEWSNAEKTEAGKTLLFEARIKK